MWEPAFETGEATIDGEVVWGTAMYRDAGQDSIVFRRHVRTVGISPGHNPPLPDPGSEVIPSDAFVSMDWGPSR